MSTITITFGDQAENHVGMQKIGEKADKGFKIKNLLKVKDKFEGFTTEYYDLTTLIDKNNLEIELESASILVIRKGLEKITENRLEELTEELESLIPDKRYYDIRRKKVLNKNARYNLCFGEISQFPNYEEGKGTIVNYNDVPIMKNVWEKLPYFFGKKAKKLVAEANYYYDVKKCGIGFHGDSERKKVVAFRVGETMPLHYQWYYKSKRIGDRFIVNLNHGDIYVMSEKAVGSDWKLRNIPTLRHAAGCEKYTK